MPLLSNIFMNNILFMIEKRHLISCNLFLIQSNLDYDMNHNIGLWLVLKQAQESFSP